ncbi:MAG: hypothetical protein M1611_01980 [Candidatus Marsarchaeota archaeon]|jgi:hypothetical protein|nr:hypothetical protein [Candidatus Marsarchaeota archaeon]
MGYIIVFDCPDKQSLIDKILDEASRAGAGRYKNYSRGAVITRGYGTWKPEKGAHPSIGKIGSVSKVPSVRIEMTCPDGKVKAVCNAIRKVHPYEEPTIYAIKVEYR